MAILDELFLVRLRDSAHSWKKRMFRKSIFVGRLQLAVD